MAVTFNCECAERKKPVQERAWVVIQYRSHASAFAGYRWTYSQWSTVKCKACGRVGRTKAKFVELLQQEPRSK